MDTHLPPGGATTYPESAVAVAHEHSRPTALTARAGVDRTMTIAGALAVGMFTVQCWLMLGSYPPGLDGAQWLALGRGMHDFGRSTDGAYAPLVPLLATGAEALVGPLPAVRLLATTACLALSLAIWLVARSLLGPRWGLLAAGIVIPASALVEPIAYGGYPQQYALAAGLVALWAAVQYLVRASTHTLWVVAAASVVAASAHHLYFPFLASSVVTAMVLAWLDSPRERPGRLARNVILAMVPASIVAALVIARFVAAGYAAPLGASAQPATEAWRYAAREAPALWALLLLLAVISLAAHRSQRRNPVWRLSASLVLPGSLLLLCSGQPRLAPPILIGTAIAVGFGAKALASRWQRTSPVIVLTMVTIVVVLFIPAHRDALRFAEYYRVADPSLIQAAEAISGDGASGAVAVRRDRRGWPIGWWFEALLTRPIVVGSEPRWLAFPEERARADEAASLFDGQLDAAAFRERTAASGVRYLVTPTWDWIGWDRWLGASDFPVTILFRDDAYLVLRVDE